MSKKLMLVLVFALVLAFSCAAYAEVQNVKIGGDMTAVGLSRDNLNFKSGVGGLNANNEFATISRIKVDADLTDSVSVTFRLLNERVWGGATGASTTVTTPTGTTTVSSTSNSQVDIAQAYVTLKEFLKPTINVPVNLIIGKQAIKIGSGLLVGAAGTNQSNTTQLPVGAGDFSTRASFDAIVAVWDWTPEFAVTTGFAKVTEGLVTEGKDTDVYIADATYKLGEDVMDTTLEATYVGSRLNRANVNNYGTRVVMSPVDNLNVEGEYVYQTNQDAVTANKEYRADAIRFGANLGMPDVVWTPSLGVDYLRVSKHWNVMHESLRPADLANLIFPNTNMQVIGATFSASPMDDVKLSARYANLRLAKKTDANIVSAGLGGAGTGTLVTNSDNKNLGYEVDLGLAYDYTSDVQFGLNYGFLKPGKALDAANRKTASQVLGSMKVSF